MDRREILSWFSMSPFLLLLQVKDEGVIKILGVKSETPIALDIIQTNYLVGHSGLGIHEIGPGKDFETIKEWVRATE